MSVAESSQHLFRIVGRSFLAFVLAPELPVDDWIDGLDAWIGRSKGFFHGRPVVVDFSHVQLTRPQVAGLLAQLQARNLRIMPAVPEVPITTTGIQRCSSTERNLAPLIG